MGWQEEDMYFYAWSIGGYTAARAAIAYPSIAGIMLDATFDHVLPLAAARSPFKISMSHLFFVK